MSSNSSWLSWGAWIPGTYALAEMTNIDLFAISTLIIGLVGLVVLWRSGSPPKINTVYFIGIITAQIPATILGSIFAYGDFWAYVLLYLVSLLCITGTLILWIDTSSERDVSSRLEASNWEIFDIMGHYKHYRRGDERLLIHDDGDLVHYNDENGGAHGDFPPEVQELIFSDTHTHTQASTGTLGLGLRLRLSLGTDLRGTMPMSDKYVRQYKHINKIIYLHENENERLREEKRL